MKRINRVKSNDIKRRAIVDKLLSEKILAKFKANNATLGEKAATLPISTTMKVERKLGMGFRKRRKTTRNNRVRNRIIISSYYTR